jgi:hypothetical protein
MVVNIVIVGNRKKDKYSPSFFNEIYQIDENKRTDKIKVHLSKN